MYPADIGHPYLLLREELHDDIDAINTVANERIINIFFIGFFMFAFFQERWQR